MLATIRMIIVPKLVDLLFAGRVLTPDDANGEISIKSHSVHQAESRTPQKEQFPKVERPPQRWNSDLIAQKKN